MSTRKSLKKSLRGEKINVHHVFPVQMFKKTKSLSAEENNHRIRLNPRLRKVFGLKTQHEVFCDLKLHRKLASTAYKKPSLHL